MKHHLISRTLLSLSCLGLPVWAQTSAAPPSPLDGAVVQLQGTVVLPAQQSEVVSMPLAGVVQAVLVSPMSAVKAGQPVARILSPQLADMQREWRAAASQAGLARAKAQRDEELFNDGIIAAQRRNESQAQAQTAELAALERRQALKLAGVADARLQDSPVTGGEPLSPSLDITAPTGGTVLEQIASPGQRLEAGSPLVRLGRADKLAIEFQAPATQLAGLRVGDVLTVEGCSKPARVSAISPQLSSATQNLMARAELTAAENCLRINQFVRLRWQRAKP